MRNTGLLPAHYYEQTEDAAAFEIACYEAGIAWAKAGNAKLPRMAEVNGTKIPVVKTVNTNGQAFVRGWKSAKA